MDSPPPPPAVARPQKPLDGTQPRPLTDRLRLLLILLVLPVCAVIIPAIAVTAIFGQRAKPKTVPPVSSTQPLRESLERSASGLFPTSSSIGADTLTVSVQAGHLAARADKIRRQAQQFGGSAVDGLSSATEKHLSISLPAGTADSFRRAVLANSPTDASASPAAMDVKGGDYVEIVVQAMSDDE